MPRLNGYQLLARLHQDPNFQDVPVIVITGVVAEDSRSDDEWAQRLGVVRFISKPLDAEKILETIRELLASDEEKLADES